MDMPHLCTFAEMEKLFLKKLSLVNFKNCAHAEMHFSPRFNLFAGNNGEGKTNLDNTLSLFILSR